MRERNARQHHIDGLFALLVFALFAACILLVLLTGADLYRGLVARDDAAYSCRTGAGYLASRVRQAPDGGAVSVRPFGDGDALVIAEEIGGSRYETLIYCHEGWLCELFAAAEDAASPAAGERVLPARVLSLRLEEGLLTVRLEGVSEGTFHGDDGGAVDQKQPEDGAKQPVQLVLSLRGEGGTR